MQNGSLNCSVKKLEFHKSKMADGRHFENRYIAISLQPFDRFWWNLTWWCILAPYSGKTIKISNFWKFKMAAADMLKITKIAISSQRFDRSLRNLVCWCKVHLLTTLIIKKIRISQIQDGGRPPFWKNPLNRYISATVWPILIRFGTVTHIGLL